MRLLELVAETGSIRKAAAGMKMSYRKAWLLLQALEASFDAPLIATATGGRAGGGARLTALGTLVAGRYRSLEKAAFLAAAKDLNALAKRTARPEKPGKTRRTRSMSLKNKK